MILIKNRQRRIPVDVESLHHDAQTILTFLGYPDFDLGILLTTNKTIRQLNKQYRHKDKPTDILSFSFYPDLKPGESIHAASDEENNLGDLVISVEYVTRAAQELGVTLEKRLKRLLVHGICHLLGYDHEKDEDYKVMLKKEQLLLKKINY